MTYCLGLLLEQGLVLASDTRTNAGVDQVAISFDSAISSNISVAAPIDLLIYRSDSFHADCQQRITETDPYYAKVRQGWAQGLKTVFSALPNLGWC